mmetsp:Transcript_78602/g.228143  ORF Transcript_78602/g.228143 Transcript_78602/m.228143 type:complete len:108 (+) Transcript_78602:49-372(+)
MTTRIQFEGLLGPCGFLITRPGLYHNHLNLGWILTHIQSILQERLHVFDRCLKGRNDQGYLVRIGFDMPWGRRQCQDFGPYSGQSIWKLQNIRDWELFLPYEFGHSK